MKLIGKPMIRHLAPLEAVPFFQGLGTYCQKYMEMIK